METRRFLIAIALSVLVLVAWQYLFAPEPLPPPPGEDAAVQEAAPAPAERPPETIAEPLPVAPPAEQPEAAVEAPVVAEPVEADLEERVVVETLTYRAEFSNRGAQLVSYSLPEHPSFNGGVVDLVRERAAGPYPFGLRTAERRPSPLNDALFAVERGRGEGGREVIEFRYSGSAGTARKSFAFRPDGMFEVEVEVEGGGQLLMGPGIRNPAAAEMKSRFTQRSAVYRTAEELEKVNPDKPKGPRIVPGVGLGWLGIQDTYFLTALVPGTPVQQAVLEPVLVQPGEKGPVFLELPAGGEVPEAQSELQRELLWAIDLPAGGFRGVGFWGPKQYEELSALPYGLQESVELGFFGFLSRPLLWGLRWIHDNVVGNYGWAIILMTILIRVVLFPLTHKSFVSMQKMQKLNPKMQAIRQKYRPKLKDKKGKPNPEMQRKMNEEIMALYKKEGVNPAGGCFPMLLQLPVLFAFYSLLSTAIELRGAPWILWIEDLAAKDPLYALPIIMGASQFVQQKLTPSSADPMQRRIFMLMPIFFTVLFLGFPSGLVLYWLTNNVLGIAQQWAYRRVQERKEAEGTGKTKPAAKAKRGK